MRYYNKQTPIPQPRVGYMYIDIDYLSALGIWYNGEVRVICLDKGIILNEGLEVK